MLSWLPFPARLLAFYCLVAWHGFGAETAPPANAVSAEPLFASDDVAEVVRRAGDRAALSDPAAQFVLGFLTDIGAGAPLDHTKAVELVRAAADQNHRQAQLYLAWRFAAGFGAQRPDSDEASRWRSRADPDALEEDVPARWFEITRAGLQPKFARALFWMLDRAEAGDVVAQSNLAQIYLEKHWTTPDTDQHLHWLRRAAENGHAPSLERLMLYYSTGILVERDEQQSARYRRAAAEAGSPYAQYTLGCALLDGDGIERNPGEAAQWLRRAAAQDQIQALERLIPLLRDGAAGLAPDHAGAATLAQRGAELGSVEASVQLADLYQRGEGVSRDFAKAGELYRGAAEKGHSRAMAMLGWMHAAGQLGAPDDAAAVEWYSKSADQGYTWSMLELGTRNLEGRGLESNPAKAFEWFERAAREGDTAAQIQVGLMLREGSGIERDHEEAMDWFRLAATNGNLRGEAHLGYHYLHGEGVAKDSVQAVQHLSNAGRTIDEPWIRRDLLHAFHDAPPESRPALRELLQQWLSDSTFLQLQGGLPEWCLEILQSAEGYADSAAAARLIEQMKTSGRHQAFIAFGYAAYLGKNRPFDLALARGYLLRAAATRPKEAERLLAEIDSITSTTAEARDAARTKLRQLADEGDVAAAMTVARRLLSGMGEDIDEAAARKYHAIAVKGSRDRQNSFEQFRSLHAIAAAPSAEELARREAQIVARRGAAKDARPQPVYNAPPAYPFELRVAAVTGSAVVEFVINTEGRPENVHCVKSTHPLFAAAAEAAAQRWRFVPALKEGKPFAIRLQQPLAFNLEKE